MNMGNWKSHSLKRRTKGSQTPGRTKGASCQADTMKRYYAKSSRSYKDPGYGQWCQAMDALNK